MRNSSFSIAALVLVVSAAGLRAQQPTENWSGHTEDDGNVYPTHFTVYRNNDGAIDSINVTISNTDPPVREFRPERSDVNLSMSAGEWSLATRDGLVIACQVQDAPDVGGSVTCIDPEKPDKPVVFRMLQQN